MRIKPTKLMLLGVAAAALVFLPKRSSKRIKVAQQADSDVAINDTTKDGTPATSQLVSQTTQS